MKDSLSLERDTTLTGECFFASVVKANTTGTAILRNPHREGIGGDLHLLHTGTYETVGEKTRCHGGPRALVGRF